MIIRSMARFFRMFSVSLTSSCIILWEQEVTQSLPQEGRTLALWPALRRNAGPQNAQVVMKGEGVCIY
jgi:hypothetical protein